ncbi:CLUMA_CG009808, isoform A [Clunio marinus]|uniref:CLUMA_CG009808, isoform A n=1 Tax=Clunio marinus TaxID=568069 RepID=A0A1J1I7V4_9DIPT|nr:CLUMA_CG009808, isoform A [Clunio marinus]
MVLNLTQIMSLSGQAIEVALIILLKFQSTKVDLKLQDTKFSEEEQIAGCHSQKTDVLHRKIPFVSLLDNLFVERGAERKKTPTDNIYNMMML